MKKFFVGIAVACVSVAIHAQGRTLSGVVADTSGNVVPYAVVELFEGADTTTFMQYAVTDTSGCYGFEAIQPGEYCLRVSHVEYETLVAMASESDTLFLTPATNSLSAAVAIANYTKFSANKITVDMEGNPLARGKTTTALLGFLPGVHKNEGAFLVFGKASTIYLDGRKLRGNGELSNIPADNIAKVEIIPIAGSRYDSTNQGSIIRIALKKENGTQGNVSLGSSAGDVGFAGWSASSYVRHRSGNLSLMGSLYAGQSWSRNTYEKESLYKDTGEETFSNSADKYSATQLQAYASAVYDFKPNHSLGLSFRAYVCPSDAGQSEATMVSGSSDGLAGSDFRSEMERNNRQFQASVNYSLGLDKNGSNLNVIADWLKDIEEYDMPYSTVSHYAGAEDRRDSQTHESWTAQDMWEVDADVEKYFDDESELDAGVSGRIISADDKYDGSGYRYKGRNISAYVQYNRQFGDLSMQAGVRYEHDRIWYKETQPVQRSYDRLFPSLVLAYEIDGDKDRFVDLSYSRRGGEMPYWYISTEKKWTGAYTYQMGNLSLGPDAVDGVELIYSHNSALSFAFIFDHRSDILTRISKADVEDPMARCITFENRGKNFYYAFDVEYKPHVTKWWTTDIDVCGAFSRFVYPDVTYDSHYAMTWWDNDFRFNKWGGTLGFSCETPRRISDETMWNGVYHSSFSVYRYLFRNKLLAMLSGQNLFGIGIARTEKTDTDDYHLKSVGTTEVWGVVLSLTYYFSAGKRRDFGSTSSVQSARKGTFSAL